MDKPRKYTFLHLTVVLIFMGTVFGFFNDWFCETMPRHQLLQLPLALLMGGIVARNLGGHLEFSLANRIASLLFVTGNLVFWMLPLSVDLAVIYPWFNALMGFTMVLSGILWFIALNQAAVEVKTVFYVMLTAMSVAMGMILANFKILLCSAFTIRQQNLTGIYLLGVGGFFLIITYYTFFKASGKTT